MPKELFLVTSPNLYHLRILGKVIMSDMVEVVIDSIRVSLMSQQRIVILREVNAERYLPIWIGIYEAEAITIALQEVEVARPLTHDLLKNIFTEFNVSVLRVEVAALQDNTFFGNIVALAVRTHVPIFVAHSVMDSVGIIPEDDLQEETEEEAEELLMEDVESSEERLSVFEDFLEGLDIKTDDDEDEDEDKAVE